VSERQVWVWTWVGAAVVTALLFIGVVVLAAVERTPMLTGVLADLQ
jgi:hypothetical protein